MDTSEQFKKSIANPMEPLYKVEYMKWYKDPIYIKMCDCEEIQSIAFKRLQLDGGWLRTSEVGMLINAITYNGEVFTFHDTIWLPRQYQLQRILWDNDEQQAQPATMLFIMLDGFPSGEGIDYRKTGNNYYRQFTSMEQLWLSYVMKEKYSKQWDGEKWQ